MDDRLMDRQIELERSMQTTGRDAYWKHVDTAIAGGMETSTKYGNDMVAQVVEPMAQAVKAYCEDDTRQHTRGPKDHAWKVLLDCDPHVASYITAKAVFNRLSQSPTKVTTVAIAIGRAIEDEARFRHFESECKPLWRKLTRDLNQRTRSRDWQRTVLIHSMGKAKIKWERWSRTATLHLGMKMLSILMQCNPWVRQITQQIARKKRTAVLQITKEGREFVRDKNARCEMFTPRYLPMLVPPRKWDSPKDGGYYTLTWDTTLVKTHNKNYLEELYHLTEQMAPVYEALNIVQAVPWKVNAQVYAVLDEVFTGSLPLGNLPPMHNEPLPTKPTDIETNATARKKWSRAAAGVHSGNTVRSSRAFQVAQVLNVAKQFLAEDALYIVHSFDFRGRLYAMGPLSPQGADYTKALLTFKEGKPIDDPVALGRLMIHGANCFGFDKVDMEARITWVAENEDAILRSASSPLDHKFWTDAESPWQFLAFCFEFAAFQAHGWGYVSSLPCTQDGSCNGLQHFSAMLRDEVGGAAVNLVPADKPSDIYAVVMDKVKAELRSSHWTDVAKMGSDEKLLAKAKLARKWLRIGPDRKLSKRPVMTLPYGATRHSCRKYVAHWLHTERPAHDFTADGEMFASTLFMARLIWDAIEGTVVAAKDAMTWLKKCARVASADGIPVNWTTPDGFPVLQSYANTKHRRVKTRLGDSTLFLTLVEPTGTLDNARQTSGISPNFVHSLDATVLRRYVLLAHDNGISSVGLVHDSFGTVAADAELSARCQRMAFINTYEDDDVIENFRRDITAGMSPKNAAKLPNSVNPPFGPLELRGIADQDYFSL